MIEKARGLHDYPMLMVVTDRKKRVFPSGGRLYRVHFLCPVCGSVGACGPKKKGYKLVVHGKWTRNLLLAAHLGVCLLEIVLKVTGVPNQISAISRLALESLSAVSDELVSETSLGLSAGMVSALKDRLTAAVDTAASAAVDSATQYAEDQLQGLQAAAEESVRTEALTPLVAEASPEVFPSQITTTTSATTTSEPKPREFPVSSDHVKAVRNMFTKWLKDPEAVHAGLTKVETFRAECVFVCGPGGAAAEGGGGGAKDGAAKDGGEDGVGGTGARSRCEYEFRRRGKNCLAVVMTDPMYL